MSEALARVRNNSVLVRPAKSTGVDRGMARRLAKRARALPARLYVGAAFSALLVGIGVNALLLQRERHPAPLFAPAHPRTTTAPTVPAPAAVAREPFPQSPPKPGAGDNGPPVHSPDQIGELLRRADDPRGDPSRTVATAQSALAKLGFPVKADGVEGAATEQALRDFERARGLPVTTGDHRSFVETTDGRGEACRALARLGRENHCCRRQTGLNRSHATWARSDGPRGRRRSPPRPRTGFPPSIAGDSRPGEGPRCDLPGHRERPPPKGGGFGLRLKAGLGRPQGPTRELARRL